MPFRPDTIRVKDNDWRSGWAEDECPLCGCRYKEHAPVEGYRWLIRLCDGELVKI
jgi:hypothetical protein